MELVQNLTKKLVSSFKQKLTKYQDKKLLESILLSFDEKDHLMVKPILQNELHHLNTHDLYYNTECPNKQTLMNKNNMMDILSLVLKEILMLRNVIGIQPMSGPVSLAYVLKYKEQESSEDIKRFALEIVSQAVEAGSRKLHTALSLAAIDDLNAIEGIDIVPEFKRAIAAEIAFEIIEEVINDLFKLAKSSTTNLKLSATDMNAASEVLLKINEMAMNIASETRRGPGNIIITSPVGIAYLKSILNKVPGYSFKDASKEFQGPTTLMYVGDIINNDVNIYKVFSIIPATPATNCVDFLITYKGGSGECDTGYFYCPYIPIMNAGTVINPETFSPEFRFMTRYGKVINVNEVDSPYHYSKLLTVELS